MRLSAADAAAAGRANRDRREKLAAGAVAQPGKFRDDLVEAGIDVVGELNFRDGTQPVDAHADSRADDAAFGNRGVDDPVLAVLALEAVRAAEHAAEVADILADDDDARVAVHDDIVRGTDRFDHVHLRHQQSSSSAPGLCVASMRRRCDSSRVGGSA